MHFNAPRKLDDSQETKYEPCRRRTAASVLIASGPHTEILRKIAILMDAPGGIVATCVEIKESFLSEVLYVREQQWLTGVETPIL